MLSSPNIVDMDFSSYFRTIGEVYYYGSASEALKDTLTWLGKSHPGEPSNVIMPGYESSSLYKMALASGYTVKFYEIYDDCRFDIDEIENLIDANTRAILVIHYFGKPADIMPVRRLADRTGQYLIEDCALALAGSVDGTPLGAIGDCSIFSARKMLTLPDGGLLVMRTGSQSFEPNYACRASSLSSIVHLILSRLKQAYFVLTGARDPLHVARLPESGHIDPTAEQVMTVREMSRLTKFLLSRVSMQRHVAKRIDNYRWLSERIREFPFVIPLMTIPPLHWTPYTLPVKIKGGNRDALRVHLFKHGIACGRGWPEGPFDPKHRRSRELASEILEFPVYPLLTRRQLSSVYRALHTFTPDKRADAGTHIVSSRNISARSPEPEQSND